MRKATYWAVFEPSATGFSVYFPDLPGCISYGDNLDNAQRLASEALGLHLYDMEKEGKIIPVASKNPEVEPETAQGYIICPVSVFPDIVKNDLDNRAVKTTITIPAWLKEIAEHEGVNYSKVFTAALKDYLRLS